MTLHIIKLCAGADGVEDLEARIDASVKRNAATDRGPVHAHITRMYPRRTEELLDGGSLYWVIRGVVLIRQRIVGFESVRGADEIERCAILLDPKPVATEAQQRRAFQGWRYLRPEDAPSDLKSGRRREPPALRAELAELGLL